MHYMLLVKKNLIDYYIINNFWSTCKKKQEANEKLAEMSRNDDYTTRN